jgi:hypothetical protein
MFLDAIVVGPAAVGLALLATSVRRLTLRAERDGKVAPENESAAAPEPYEIGWKISPKCDWRC